MSTTCIIVEDQPPAQRVLQKYVRDYGNLILAGTFNDSLSALEFLKTNQVDLVFLDIHLPKLSGIDFLKIVHPRPQVILTTAFSEYALQGYELDVVDYLLKPFSFERFVKAVNKAAQLKHSPEGVNIPQDEEESHVVHQFIKSGNEYIRIHLPSIKYVKSDGDYTRVYLEQSQHIISHPLRYWVEILPKEIFCQVHKSFIVNVNAIKKVVGNQVIIGDLKIPVGRTYKDVFFRQYLEQGKH